MRCTIYNLTFLSFCLLTQTRVLHLNYNVCFFLDICLPFQFLFPSLFLWSLSCSHLHLSSLFINPLCKLQTTKVLRFRQFFAGKTLRDLVHLVECYVFHTLKMLSSTINKLLFLLSSFKGV